MQEFLQNKKVALVADWISDWGGAERVFAKLMEMFPDADIYTSVFFQQNNPLFKERKVTTSFLQNIPYFNRRHKMMMSWRPLAFESFDLDGYDLVISSSSAESKGIITNTETLHICYCHTPTRYLWSHQKQYEKYLEFGVLNPLARFVMKHTIPKMKKWDYCAAQRPNVLIANSKNTQERIKKYYNRESELVYPFFEKGEEAETGNGDYYFAIGRIVPYKKFDLLVNTFNKNGKKLIIVTSTINKLCKKLMKESKKNISWITNVSDSEVAALFAGAKAYIMPQEEDFGITPLEAMSHGVPVIAYDKGGAQETVIEGETGTFFETQTTDSLNAAIEKFEKSNFDPEICKSQAEKFSEEMFEKGLIQVLEKHLQQ